MIRVLAGAAVAAAVWVCWPFPPSGADPVADLIALRSPRPHAAIRAWHYLAPASAFVGLWSAAVAVGRVWFAGGDRSPVAGRLPPWPAGADDPGPSVVVVGEMHHPVDEREVAPRWLVLPELASIRGVLSCGAIGSARPPPACATPLALISASAALVRLPLRPFGPANARRTGATTRRAGCDSGCDSG